MTLIELKNINDLIKQLRLANGTLAEQVKVLATRIDSLETLAREVGRAVAQRVPQP